MMNQVLILTIHNITNSYSCLFYLADRLNNKYNVDVWGFGDKTRLASKYQKYFHPFDECWFGKIRRFRLYCAKIKVFNMLLHFNGIVIIDDLDFYFSTYTAHKINPNFKVVHYNTEIPGKDFPYSHNVVKFYANHTDFPDLIVECNSGRAKYRKRKYDIKQEIIVVDNTIPTTDLLSTNITSQVREWATFDNDNPILIYAGGCDANRALGGIIESMSNFSARLNFLFFCYGQKNSMSKLRSDCLDGTKNGYCKIYNAISRGQLLAVMKLCDYGVNYYDPSYSVSYKYAAPSKFYEYLGTGLKILSTDNEGINHIIEKNGVGVCIKPDESITSALDRLISTVNISKDEIVSIFNKNYSFEAESKKLIDKIDQLMLTI